MGSHLANLSAVKSNKLPVCIRGGYAFLGSVLGSGRDDGRVFVVYRAFTNNTCLKYYRMAYPEVFVMVDVISLLE